MEKIKIKVDIAKAQIDAIHKRFLVFLGVGAGSWLVGVDFLESEVFLKTLFSIPIFILFSYSSFGLFVNMIKLSKRDSKLENLEKDLDNV